MFRRIFAVMLAVLLLSICCGCGDKKESDVTSEVNSMPESSQISSDETESEEKPVLNITVTSAEIDKFSSGRTNDPNKQDISLILVVGQSNFTPGVGYSDEYDAYTSGKTANIPESPMVPAKGTAYSFDVSTNVTDLTDAGDMSILCRTNRASVLGGVTPSFAVQWNALTDTKVVFIQAAVGAVGVHEWTPDPTKYTCTCTNNGNGKLYSNAVTAYTKAITVLSQKYDIKYTGYIWNQGEHDEVYGAKPGVTVCDAQSYYDAYKEMHDGFMDTLNLDFGGISVVRANEAGSTAQGSNSYTIARAAQYKLCNDLDDLYMLSTIGETCSHAMMDQGNTIHYSQTVFNMMGADIANNLFSILGLGDSNEYTGIRIYSGDGSVAAKFDAAGKITEGSDVLTRPSTYNNIIVRPDTLGTKHKIEFKLDIEGADGSKYIDGFGAIDWTALYKDLKIQELGVTVTVK